MALEMTLAWIWMEFASFIPPCPDAGRLLMPQHHLTLARGKVTGQTLAPCGGDSAQGWPRTWTPGCPGAVAGREWVFRCPAWQVGTHCLSVPMMLRWLLGFSLAEGAGKLTGVQGPGNPRALSNIAWVQGCQVSPQAAVSL